MTTTREDNALRGAMHDRACEWIARLRADDVSEQDREAFALWLAASPAHRAAMDDMLDLWEDLELCKYREHRQNLDNREHLDTREHQEAAPPVGRDIPLKVATVATESQEAPAQTGRSRWLATGVALAASILVAMLLSPALQLTPGAQSFATGLGEQLSVNLEDGSRIRLNTSTALSVSFEPAQRVVTLEQGEAFFQVASSVSRPFVVLAGNTEVRVLGTAFSVTLHGERSEVTVSEGVVRVSERDAPPTRPAQTELLYKDQQISADGTGLDSTIEVRADQVLAWRDGKLVAEEMPLAELVEELSRYHPNRIFIAEPGLAGTTVSGVFRLEDLDSILLALEHTVDVRGVTLDDGSIQLTRSPL